MKNTHWTNKEEDKLREVYRHSKEELCKEFEGRTWSAISVKINRLGLKRNQWTLEEELKLKEIYEYSEWHEMLKSFPSRSKKAIAAKADSVGLKRKGRHKRKNEWRHEEKEYLKAVYPRGVKSEILERLTDRSWIGIIAKANTMKIKREVFHSLEIDKEDLYKKYFVDNLNIRQCEEYFDCSNQVILMRLREWYAEEFEKKIKTIGMKYDIERVISILEKENYKLIDYKSIEGFIRTTDHIVIQCTDTRHSHYKVTLSDFLMGYRCKQCYIDNNKGENHPNYNPDITDEEREVGRKIPGYEEWRCGVYARDEYTCKKCKDDTGGNLVAHHLDGYDWCKEKRTYIKNGITLCDDCHKDFHKSYGYGNNTKKQYLEWVGIETR